MAVIPEQHCETEIFEDMFTSPGSSPKTTPCTSKDSSVTSSEATERRARKQRKTRKEIEEIDLRIEAIRGALTASHSMDDVTHFVLSLVPAMKQTPNHMQQHLRLELQHIVACYSAGNYPSLLIRNLE